MVQKSKGEQPKPRGRPRAYDPHTALGQVIESFWNSGYSGTSLDDISAATAMNRPSLYAAFGDKQALYLKSLDRYWDLGLAAMREALLPGVALEEALLRAYDSALSIYFSGNGAPRGCFGIGTALTEAVHDPEIRAALANGLRALDEGFEARIRASHAAGELKSDADPATLAFLASATLHTIAIRARAGASRAKLRKLARNAVAVICAQPAKSD